jgi:uncharacterized membrane protein
MQKRLGEFLKIAVDHWTSKTPKNARRFRNTMLVIGITSSIISAAPIIMPILIPIIPIVSSVTIPTWSISLSSFIAATAAQFLKE